MGPMSTVNNLSEYNKQLLFCQPSMPMSAANLIANLMMRKLQRSR